MFLELAGENVIVAVFGMGEDAGGRGERLRGGAAGRRRRRWRAPRTRRAGRAFAPPPPWGELAMTPREAFLGPQEVVPVDAGGRAAIAAESLAAYPPGIPNVLPGERLTAETLGVHPAGARPRRQPARRQRPRAARRCAWRSRARGPAAADYAQGQPPEGVDRLLEVRLGRVLLLAWLSPPLEGAKTIATGSRRATSAASCRAPLASARAPSRPPPSRRRPGARRTRSARSPDLLLARLAATADRSRHRRGAHDLEQGRKRLRRGWRRSTPARPRRARRWSRRAGAEACRRSPRRHGGAPRSIRERGRRREAGVAAQRPSAWCPRAPPGPEAQRSALDARAPVDRGDGEPSPRAPGPARCEAPGRRRGRSRALRALGGPVDVHAVLGQHLAQAAPSASVRPRPRGSRVPAKAELPNRLRPKREPSSSAQSTSATVARRTRSPRPARSTLERPPSGRAPRRASRRRAPNRGASRAPAPGRSRRRAAPRGCRPRRSSSATPRSPAAARARQNARGPPVSVQPSRRAPPSPPVRRSSSRRSAITRSASIAGAQATRSRRIACTGSGRRRRRA